MKQNIDRSKLLDSLDISINKAAIIFAEKDLNKSKKPFFVGSIRIDKNKFDYYDILTLNREILFKNISTFDIALSIAQRYNDKEISSIRKILKLDEQYSKYHSDMVHYLHCLKGARNNKDLERMAILEDKFQVAESLARIIRNKILSFKKTNTSSEKINIRSN